MSDDNGIRERVRLEMKGAGLPGMELEKAVFNNAIRRCKFNTIPCCWGNIAFSESYKSSALAIIRNPEPVLSCINAGISESDIVMKTPQEIRPDIWKELVENKKERDSAYGARPAANTSMYRCRKCQSKECHYFGLQTRSGDEPMTIFVTCLNCGNRWRTEG